MKEKPKILEKTVLARSGIFCVEGLHLRFENGEERHYERLRAGKHRGAVMVAALYPPCSIILVKEYAAGIDDYYLGFPKGLIEINETLFEAANRELKEEVGFGARTIEHLTTLSLAPAYMDHKIDLLLAYDLYPERYFMGFKSL
jgi:ADP-ribose diphosphatase